MNAFAAIEVIAEGVDHPEAVIWDAERSLLFCGGEEGQLYAVTLAGSAEVVADTGGSLLGLALDAAGIVYACDAGNRSVVAIDPDTGSVSTVSTGVGNRPFTEPNGIALDASGNLYVADSGSWDHDNGFIARIDTDCRTSVWSRDAPSFPNGCLVEGDYLLVVQSRRPAVVALPLPTNVLGARRDPVPLPACVPDQIAVDVDGNLIVGCYRPDIVLRATPGGSISELASDPSGMALCAPTGCAFAGPRLETLVVANYGARQLVAIPTTAGGRPVPRPARLTPVPQRRAGSTAMDT